MSACWIARHRETSRIHHATSDLPIQKVTPVGDLAINFRIKDALPGVSAMDFSLARTGRVYVEAWTPSDRQVYVLVFSSNGSLQSKIQLDAEQFIPYQIAVFESGEFLLSGIRGDHNRTPFTAVFSASGKLIKEIYEAEDEDSRRRAAAGELDYVPDGLEYSNTFVTHGDAVTGSDGNVYLLRAASPALIYVISPLGKVIRKLKIDSSEPGLLAARLQSVDQKLAVVFLHRGMNTGVIKIVDYQGDQVGIYAPDDPNTYPGLLGCYKAKTLTFLSVDNENRIGLNRAELK